MLQADNEQLEASLAAATAQVSNMQAQLASLSELQETLQASLQGKQSAEASLMTQLTQVRRPQCSALLGVLHQRQLTATLCLHQHMAAAREGAQGAIDATARTPPRNNLCRSVVLHICCCRRVLSWMQLRCLLQR